MSRPRIVTVVGTRPEIIRLSRVIPHLDEVSDHVLGDACRNAGRSLVWRTRIWKSNASAHRVLQRMASNVKPKRMASGMDTICTIASQR